VRRWRQSTGKDRKQMPPGATVPNTVEPVRSPQGARASIALPHQAGKAALFGLHSCKPIHQADSSSRLVTSILAEDSCKRRIAAGMAALAET
jgi:hypothetical protein